MREKLPNPDENENGQETQHVPYLLIQNISPALELYELEPFNGTSLEGIQRLFVNSENGKYDD